MILSGIPNTNTLCVIVQGRKEGLWSSEKENPPVPETFSLSLSHKHTLVEVWEREKKTEFCFDAGARAQVKDRPAVIPLR